MTHPAADAIGARPHPCTVSSRTRHGSRRLNRLSTPLAVGGDTRSSAVPSTSPPLSAGRAKRIRTTAAQASEPRRSSYPVAAVCWVSRAALSAASTRRARSSMSCANSVTASSAPFRPSRRYWGRLRRRCPGGGRRAMTAATASTEGVELGDDRRQRQDDHRGVGEREARGGHDGDRVAARHGDHAALTGPRGHRRARVASERTSGSRA